MNKYSGNLTRISKPEARRRYNAGEEVYLTPCKMHPENPYWDVGLWLTFHDLEDRDKDTDFDKFCNFFTFYNCMPETGRYIAFYIK